MGAAPPQGVSRFAAKLIHGGAAFLLGVLLCTSADAIAIKLALNFDGTATSEYRGGNKPQTPGGGSDWTKAFKGDAECANASIEEDSMDSTLLDFVACGTNDSYGWGDANYGYAYRSISSGDAQVICELPDTAWGIETYSGAGCVVTDGTAATDWESQCYRYWESAPSVFKYGIPNDAPTTPITLVNGVDATLPALFGLVVEENLNGSEERITCLVSVDDGSSWNIVGEIFREMPSPFLIGSNAWSHHSTQTVSLRIETAFTTTVDLPVNADPGGGNEPTCSGLSTQSGTEGVAFSYDVGALCSDPNSGTIEYSASGLTSTGLSINSSTGIISGTPTSAAASASPIAVTVTVDDNDDGSNDYSFTLNITAASGSTCITINASSSQQDVNASSCSPGDTILLDFNGTSHTGKLVIRNIAGTSSSPVQIVNDTADATPATFSRASGSGNFLFVITNSEHFVLDGTGKYSGAPSGTCGDDADLDEPDIDKCGIFLTVTGAASPSSFLMITGTSHNFEVKGIACDGRKDDATSVTPSGFFNSGGICFQVNDHTLLLPQGITQLDVMNGVAGTSQYWRENIVVSDSVCKFHRGECWYLGPNYGTTPTTPREYPLRNIEMARLRCWHTAECGRLKSVFDTWSIHDMVAFDAGAYDNVPANPAIYCYTVFEAGEGTGEFYNNKCINMKKGAHLNGGEGVNFQSLQRPSSFGIVEIHAYGNLIYDTAASCLSANVPSTSLAGVRVIADYNTLVDCGVETGFGKALNASGIASGSLARGNIAAGSNSSIDNEFTSSDNTTNGTASAQGFTTYTDDTDFTDDDFSLNGTGPNIDTGGTTCSALTDLAGVSRPQGANCDRGAYEYEP